MGCFCKTPTRSESKNGFLILSVSTQHRDLQVEQLNAWRGHSSTQHPLLVSYRNIHLSAWLEGIMSYWHRLAMSTPVIMEALSVLSHTLQCLGTIKWNPMWRVLVSSRPDNGRWPKCQVALRFFRWYTDSKTWKPLPFFHGQILMCRTPWTLNSPTCGSNLDWFLPFRRRAPPFDNTQYCGHLIRYTWEQGLLLRALVFHAVTYSTSYLFTFLTLIKDLDAEHFCCPCQVDYPRCAYRESLLLWCLCIWIWYISHHWHRPRFMACRWLVLATTDKHAEMSFKEFGSGWQRRNMTSTLIWHGKGKKIFPQFGPLISYLLMVDTNLCWSGLNLHPWQSWLLYWSISMLVVYVGCSSWIIDMGVWLYIVKGVDTECFWGVPSFSGFFLDTRGEDGHWLDIFVVEHLLCKISRCSLMFWLDTGSDVQNKSD